jgi:hypothetical protein
MMGPVIRNRLDQFGKNMMRDLLLLGGDPQPEQEVRQPSGWWRHASYRIWNLKRSNIEWRMSGSLGYSWT